MGKKSPPEFFSGDEGGSARRARWAFGEFELDETRRELCFRGQVVTLEPKPFNLLMLFLRHQAELITKDDLIDALWAGRIVTESVLTRCVAKLRQSLNDDTQEWIKTVHGYGYRFDAPVTLLNEEAGASAAAKVDLVAGAAVPLRGNWRLLRRLGRSGDAWLAEHAKTRAQRVYKFTNDPRALPGLKREVTIFRLLKESIGDARCSVEVIDWNFDEPPWFIESEYCVGGSLQEWLEAQGGVQAVPLAVRLDIIIQIAEALAQVHALGVLHKDLKPANVLIVPEGVGGVRIRLGDFGSGRLLDPARLEALDITRMGFTTLVDEATTSSGTPLYYAPEIVAGKPFTVQADIYALGVMLFQLVTGNLRRPLAPGWEREVDDEMLREDIGLAADGNPDDRLSDVALLADRLRQIETRRDASVREQRAREQAEAERRAAERMRARRAGIRVAVAVLILGLMVSTYLYFQARTARDRAETEARRAQAVSDFLSQGMLATISRGEQPVKDLTVKQLLDAASAEVPIRFPGQPDIAAQIYEALGRSQLALEFPGQAYADLDHALSLLESSGKQTSESAVALTETLVGLAWPVGQLGDQLPRYQAILDAATLELGGGHPRVLSLRFALASARARNGEWVRAGEDLRQAGTLMARAAGHDRALLTRTQLSYSAVLLDLTSYGEAERLLRQLLQSGELSPVDTATARARLGQVLSRTGRYHEAAVELDAAQAIFRDWMKDDGASMLTVDLYRAYLQLEQHRPELAIPQLNSVLAVVQRWAGRGVDQSYVEFEAIGRAQMQQGDLERATATLEQAVDVADKALGAAHPLTRGIRLQLIEAWRRSGRMDQAWAGLNGAEALNFDDLPPMHLYNADLHRERGMVLLSRGDRSTAREELRKAAHIYDAVLGAGHWRSQELARRLAALA